MATFRHASWLLFWVLSGLVIVALIVLRVPIGGLVLGGPEYAKTVSIMGLAVLFNLASTINLSTLTTYHRVGVLARAGILNTLLGSAVSVGLVWFWREQGIAPAIIAGAAINWTISHRFVRQEIGEASERSPRPDIVDAARSLIRFGAPYTASMLVGTGVQLLLPILVFHSLGMEEVGFYRAAVAVSVSYLGFLLAAMAQDYYPRVSAARDDPQTLVHLVNQQHRVVMLLSVPMVLGPISHPSHLYGSLLSCRGGARMAIDRGPI
jgi:PST family polysaccharide transporter